MTEMIHDDRGRRWRLDWWGSDGRGGLPGEWVATATRGTGPRPGELRHSSLMTIASTESDALDRLYELIMPSREILRRRRD